MCLYFHNLDSNKTIIMKKRLPIIKEVEAYQYFLILLFILLLGVLTK